MMSTPAFDPVVKTLLADAVNEFTLGTAAAGDVCRQPSDLSAPLQREMRQGEAAYSNAVAFVRTNRRHWWVDWNGATKVDLTWDAPHTPDPGTGLVTDRPGSWRVTFTVAEKGITVTEMRLWWTDPDGRKDAVYPLHPANQFPADPLGFNDCRWTACLPPLPPDQSSDPRDVLDQIQTEGADDATNTYVSAN